MQLSITALDRYELILFDVDQTLLDFAQAENEAIAELWRHSFSNVVSQSAFAEQYRRINVEIWKAVETGELLPSQVKETRAKRVLQHYDLHTENWEAGAEVFLTGLSKVAIWLPGAEASFHAIRTTHKVGLITNGLVQVQYPRIDAIGIRSYLATYMISQEVGFTKPDPRIFKLAFEEVGVDASKALYIGDSLSSDYQGALNANMDFCWFNPDNRPLPSTYREPSYILTDWHQLS